MTHLLHTATLSISALLLFAHQTYAQPLQRYELFGTSSKPMALESGQASGLAVGYSHLVRSSPRRSLTENLTENRAVNRERERGFALSFGALLGYGSATENSLAWSITHQELRGGSPTRGGMAARERERGSKFECRGRACHRAPVKTASVATLPRQRRRAGYGRALLKSRRVSLCPRSRYRANVTADDHKRRMGNSWVKRKGELCL